MPTLLQKVCLGFAVGCAGDAGGQWVATPSGASFAQTWDARRTALWGAGVAGLQVPLFHAWFRFLDARIAGQGFAAGAKKAVIESCTVGPMYLALVNAYATLVIQEGYKTDAPAALVRTSLEERFVESYQRALCIMLPAQLVSHSVVPLAYKVAYLNVVSSVWNIVLSQMLCQKREDAAAVDA